MLHPMYQEPFRPQFHFTPERNWMNDPNGMVYHDGEYHLFYQYNPFGDKWGHMSWGHAVSRDLVHWKHLPVALAEEGDLRIYSGSAVVDFANSSGFGTDGPPLVAIYTGHREESSTRPRVEDQRLAYSNDRGRTWTHYPGNPVLDIGLPDFRDPKVFWHEPDEALDHGRSSTCGKENRDLRFGGSQTLGRPSANSARQGPGGIQLFGNARTCFRSKSRESRRLRKWVLIVNINPGGPAGRFGNSILYR